MEKWELEWVKWDWEGGIETQGNEGQGKMGIRVEKWGIRAGKLGMAAGKWGMAAGKLGISHPGFPSGQV